jgi:hypothetical protein
MLQLKVTPEALKPFVGAIVIVEVADWPSDTDDGVIVEAERLKSAVMGSALDVLVLKLPSPGYAAVIMWTPAVSEDVVKVATPFAFRLTVPS